MANAYAKVVTKAWSDPEYKARLKAEPNATLAEAGVDVPEGVEIQVLEDTDTTMHLVLPASPAGETLSEEELDQIAGGRIIVPGDDGGWHW
jgi:hypothetical protein